MWKVTGKKELRYIFKLFQDESMLDKTLFMSHMGRILTLITEFAFTRKIFRSLRQDFLSVYCWPSCWIINIRS